jgi:O-antigen ligase
VATLGVYFIKRFRWKGVAVGAILAIPIMMLGGRADADADSSTEERLECWAEAFDLWRSYPVFGVGAKQFGEHHYLTAHNSALLSLADMGPLGLFLFTAAIYFAFKITIQVQRDFATEPEAEPARAAAFAVFSGLTGLVTSALFLSLTYHMALWIELALAGAVCAAVRRHAPDWRVRFGWRDAAAIAGLDVALVAGIAIYLKFKGVM